MTEELSERDLTRLSYLMASLVATPQRAERLLDLVRADASQDAFRQVVDYLRTTIQQSSAGTDPNAEVLQKVAHQLVQQHHPTQQITGRLLAGALESAQGRSR